VADDAPPADIDAVRYAFRLGWAVSELRGRYRPTLFADPTPLPALPEQPGAAGKANPLPLAGERRPAEVRIEIREAIAALAKALSLAPAALATVADTLTAFERTRPTTSEPQWPRLAEELWTLDAQIQDELVLPGAQAAAYQLGRGLADTYWALAKDADSSGTGPWSFLFGETRRLTIGRSALRLSAYLGPSVIAAIAGPLDAWAAYLARVASDGQQRAPDELLRLYKQSLLWRDLIRGERLVADLHDDPDTPNASTQRLWLDAAFYRGAILPILPPLLVGFVFAGLLAYFATLLATGTNHTFLASVISVLASLGVTSAGLYTRAKARLLSVYDVLKAAVETERAREEASYAPPAPVKRHRWRQAVQFLGP